MTGGQGRTDQEVAESAAAAGFCLLALPAIVLLAALLNWLFPGAL